MSYLAYTQSVQLLKQLPEERKIVKQYKNEELMLTPQSNRSSQIEALENLEMQWQHLRRQHLENRSTSKSPAKCNLANQLRSRDKQLILQKVVPLSTINLSHLYSDSAQKHTLKESSHFQYIANKYSNIYRRPSPEQQTPTHHLNRVVSHQYQKNNLKVINERVRTNSQDKSVLQNSNISQKREVNQRKRVSQYQKSEIQNYNENRSQQRSLTHIQQQAIQNQNNQRVLSKRRR